jgi:hypothetical protein
MNTKASKKGHNRIGGVLLFVSFVFVVFFVRMASRRPGSA